MKEEIRHIEGLLKEAIEQREDAAKEMDKDLEIYYNGHVNAIKRILNYLNI